MNLEQKIEHVLQRVKDGYFDQSMSPEETDIDMVLIDCLKEIKRLSGIIESDDYVLVNKSKIDTWYLNESEGMYFDIDGIDCYLSNLEVGEVAVIERLNKFNISDTYVAKPWDKEDQDAGCWEQFDSKEEAERVAKHCKAMFDSQ